MTIFSGHSKNVSVSDRKKQPPVNWTSRSFRSGIKAIMTLCKRWVGKKDWAQPKKAWSYTGARSILSPTRYRRPLFRPHAVHDHRNEAPEAGEAEDAAEARVAAQGAGRALRGEPEGDDAAAEREAPPAGRARVGKAEDARRRVLRGAPRLEGAVETEEEGAWLRVRFVMSGVTMQCVASVFFHARAL